MMPGFLQFERNDPYATGFDGIRFRAVRDDLRCVHRLARFIADWLISRGSAGSGAAERLNQDEVVVVGRIGSEGPTLHRSDVAETPTRTADTIAGPSRLRGEGGSTRGSEGRAFDRSRRTDAAKGCNVTKKPGLHFCQSGAARHWLL
jgi:hypothetical protein